MRKASTFRSSPKPFPPCPPTAAASKTDAAPTFAPITKIAKISLRAGKPETARTVGRQSDDLIAQLCFAAPETVEIVAQDLDHVVLVPPGLSRRMGRDQHVLHAP